MQELHLSTMSSMIRCGSISLYIWDKITKNNEYVWSKLFIYAEYIYREYIEIM